MCQDCNNLINVKLNDTGNCGKNFYATINDAFWLSLGQAVFKLSKVSVVILAVAFLGIKDYGIFSIILAFLSIFYIPASLLHTLSPMVRDLSLHHNSNYKREILIENLSFRVILGFSAILLGFLGNLLYDYEIWVFILLGLALFFDYMRDFFTASLESRLEMKNAGCVFIWHGVFLFVLSIVFLFFESSITSLALGYFLSSLFALFTSVVLVSRHFSFNWIFVKPKWTSVKNFIDENLSFGLFWALPNNLMFQVLLVVLSLFLLESEVGVFSIVFQGVQLFTLPYIMFANSLLPRVSRHTNKKEFNQKVASLFRFFNKTTIIAVLVFSFGALFFLPIIFPNEGKTISDYFFKFGFLPLLFLPSFVALAYTMLILGIFKRFSFHLLSVHLAGLFLILLAVAFFGKNSLIVTVPGFLLATVLFALKNIKVFSADFYREMFNFSFLPSVNFIAFSGLGGSGKTTQIRFLKEFLLSGGYDVYVVEMRKLFIWPKITGFLNRKRRINSGEKNKNFLHPRSLFYFYARAIFYLFDFYRVWFWVFIKSIFSDAVIFDRFFDDFIIELELSSSKSHKWMLKLLPTPKMHFYFRSQAEVVFNRKKEDTLENILVAEKKYEELFRGMDIFCFDADKPLDLIKDKVCNLVGNYFFVSSKRVSFYGFVLFRIIKDKSFGYFESGVFEFSFGKLLKLASYNRILWLISRYSSESKTHSNNKLVLEINKICLESRDIGIKTETFLKEKLPDIEIFFEKNDKFGADFSGDLDVVVKDRESFDCFMDELKRFNPSINLQTARKADLIISGLKPIDLHLGAEFGFLSYASPEDLARDREGISSSLLVGHMISELGMLNWGDLYKLFNMSIQEISAGRLIAKKNGWVGLYDYIIFLKDNPEKSGFNFPVFLPATKMFYARVFMFLKGRGSWSLFFREIFMLFRVLRVRRQGKIPFHPEWFSF